MEIIEIAGTSRENDEVLKVWAGAWRPEKTRNFAVDNPIIH
ncbi:unknown [Prevotella sp. CAG:1320]|nr:unknown [Prevotella sp. CAG:1320]